MAAGTFSGVLGRHRRARFVAGHLGDLLVVVVLCVLVGAITRPAVVGGRLDIGSSTSVLTLVAAAIGSAAAIAALVTARLTGDARPSWFGAALLLYGVVLLPTSTLLVPAASGNSAPRLALLSMLVVALGTFVLAVRPPRRLGSWGGWVLVAVGLGASGVVALQRESEFTVLLAGGPLTSIVTQVGWAAVALLFLFDGYRRQSRIRVRLALGLLVIAISQLYRAVVPSEPVNGLIYPSLRILGMTVVLAALLTMALRAVSRLQDEYDRLEETLGQATRLLERATGEAAERDHELRNGLAGLAGAAYLLSHEDGDEMSARMRVAVLAELSRLRLMLESTPTASGEPGAPPVPAGDAELLDYRADPRSPSGGASRTGAPARPPAPGQAHDVGPVLRELVFLRDDALITAEVDADLPAVTAPEFVTRQVVTSLLANCERHAGGARVVVRGRRAEPGFVAVEVRDEGPGLHGGREEWVIRRGAHDPEVGGSGLGMHVNARLAHEHGGTLVLRTAHDPRGCSAVLTLPVAA